jgi:hypothetical protein
MISTAESGSSCRFPQLNLKFCQRIMAGVSSADSVSSWKFRQLIASTGTEVLDGAERLADLVGRGHEEEFAEDGVR